MLLSSKVNTRTVVVLLAPTIAIIEEYAWTTLANATKVSLEMHASSLSVLGSPRAMVKVYASLKTISEGVIAMKDGLVKTVVVIMNAQVIHGSPEPALVMVNV